MLTVSDVFCYLVGRESAILRVAGHPKALWVGLVFVLAAGFGREYDGEDLLHAPWHLFLPLGASLVTSLVLYVVLRVVSAPGVEKSRFFSGYPTLLRLYWFTAPLAFVYAIPVERLMGAGDATEWNLLFLGLVSAWRVLLITRAASVTWEQRYAKVLFPVMLFADGIALALLFVIPLPIVSLMGGIRLTESEAAIRATADRVLLLGFLTVPLWIVGTAIAHAYLRKTLLCRGTGMARVEGRGVSKPLIFLCALALLVWLPILPLTQPEQQRRRQVEEQLLAGRHAEAVTLVKHVPRGAFPPHWDPPPRTGYGERAPNEFAVLAAALDGQAPYWFVETYVRKAEEDKEGRRIGALGKRILASLPRYVEAERLATAEGEWLWWLVERCLDDDEIPEDLRALLVAHAQDAGD